MYVLSHHWSDLLRGYQSVVRLNDELHQEWDEELDALIHKVQQKYKRHYKNWQAADRTWEEKESEKDQLFESVHAEWEKCTEPLRKAYQIKLRDWQKEVNGKKFWSIAFLILAIIGLLIILIGLLSFEPILPCIGMIAAILFGAIWISFQNKLSRLKKSKPEIIYLDIEPQRQQPNPRPTPPSKPDLSKPVFDLVKEWWSYIEAEPAPDRNYGYEGERALLQALGDRLPNEFIALHQLKIAQNIDLDVLVLGPNGIWILESKFWSGTILCQNGEWRRIKDNYETGGIESTKEDRIDKPFDEEWNYEEETIRNRLAAINQGDFYVEILKGGLVFTYPDVQLDIDTSCQVEFGKTDEWVEKIITGPVVPEFSIRNILSVVDRLMFFAAPLEEIKPSSANIIPETLYSENKQRLETFRNNVTSLFV